MWLSPGSWFKAMTPASHAPTDQPAAQPLLCEHKDHRTSASRMCGCAEPKPDAPMTSTTANSSLFPATLRLLHSLNTGASGEEPACQCSRHKGCGFHPWIGKIPWRRAWQPTPVFLPGESHGQRSLVGYSLWGRQESDTTEVT